MKKRLIPVALAVTALLAAASPVFAAWFIDKSSGQPGAFDYAKWPAVVCKFDVTSQTLETMTVRAPKLWSVHDDVTAVGWRFQIREAIEFHLEGLREDGIPVPESSTVAQYVEI